MTGASVLFVHAHPDDETITTGGTIAEFVSRGRECRVVTCTLGEEGEVLGDTWAGLVADRADQLGGFRIAELGAALDALGAGPPNFLGGAGRFRDSGMVGTTGLADPRAFVRNRDAAVPALVAEIDAFAPDLVVTYDPDGGYGHPDHVMAYEITVAALERSTHVPSRLAWTVTDPAALEIRHSSPPAPLRSAEPGELPSRDDATTYVALSERAFAAKLEALRAHATQLQVVPDDATGRWFLSLTNGVLQPLPRAEHYVVFDVDPGTRELTRCAQGSPL